MPYCAFWRVLRIPCHTGSVADDEFAVTQVRSIWPETDELPLIAANQFATQLLPGADDTSGPEGVLLLVGSAHLPVIVGGDPGELQARLEQGIPVHVDAKYQLSRQRAVELIGILTTVVGQFDQASGQLEKT